MLDGPHQGVAVARNKALQAATGDWIAFCDADDIPEPDWLEVLYANAVRDRADLSCCAFWDIAGKARRLRRNFPIAQSRRLPDPETIRHRLLRPLLTNGKEVHGYLFAALFRRALIEKDRIRFTPGVSMKEDVLFLMDYLAGAERVTATGRPLYNYMRAADSATARHRRVSAYEREANWFRYAAARRRIFMRRKLAEHFPELRGEIDLKMFLHEIQAICCDPETVSFQRMEQLRRTACAASRLELRPDGIAGKVLLFCLFHCRWLIPPLCLARRTLRPRAAD